MLSVTRLLRLIWIYYYFVCVNEQTNAIVGVAAHQTCSESNNNNIYGDPTNNNVSSLLPTLYVGILVSNKDYVLPYFLNGLDEQIYAKDRIQLEFRLDNSYDQSDLILTKWIESVKHQYHNIVLHRNDTKIVNEPSESERIWFSRRFAHVMYLRQSLWENARKSKVDIYLSIDADVILINKDTFAHFSKLLIGNSQMPESNCDEYCHTEQLTIVAPLMNCTNLKFYSNFWGAMLESGYYARSENYIDLLHRHTMGLFPVAMLHTILFINMHQAKANQLTYEPWPNYEGPFDDIIVFARSAHSLNISLHLDNTQFYGYIFAPVEEHQLGPHITDVRAQTIEVERELFLLLRLEAAYESNYVFPSVHLKGLIETVWEQTEWTKMDFDEIYLINLLRRPDRLVKMNYVLKQLGINATHRVAVDGNDLSEDRLVELGIKQLEGYLDPYYRRPMKFGEVGCFLSHYYIWKEMVEKNLSNVLILEDDSKFNGRFKTKLSDALTEAKLFAPNWDMIYVGRKILSRDEIFVENATSLIHAAYSYWTVGYVLSLSGARKLIAQNPLTKLVPVDEYIGIMADTHPNREWSEQFYPRDLIVLSVNPLLIEPQFYIGQGFYYTDTENSKVWHAT